MEGYRRARLVTVACLSTLACAGCSANLGFLHPAGPIAGAERELFFWALTLTIVVITPVILLTPWLVWRYRRNNARADYRPRWESSTILEVLAWGVPVLIVTILSVFLWRNAFRLDPYRALAGTQAPLRIQVIALDWKWLFIYPDRDRQFVDTGNVLVGQPVSLVITSDTVMQSLLIPRLAGQIYAMAGMRTQLHLQADHAGTFSGENTQYNGDGFARQKFRVLALPPEKFTGWIEHARQSESTLDCATYGQLSRRDTIDKPRFYRNPAPSWFKRVIADYRDKSESACAAPRPGNAHD